MSNNIKVHDVVCLITPRSTLSPIFVTKTTIPQGIYISGTYLTDKKLKVHRRVYDDFVKYSSLVEYCVAPIRVCESKQDGYRIEQYINMNSMDSLNERLHQSIHHLSQDQIEAVIGELHWIDPYSILELYNSSCRKYGDESKMFTKAGTTTTTTSKEKTMTKLYKVIKSDKGTVLKTPKDFGEYMATDGEFIMLKMTGQSTTSDKPVIQAFKPDQIEEVLPWTFKCDMIGGKHSYDFIGKKNSVKVSDILTCSKSGNMYIVKKINTKYGGPCNIPTFVGSKVMMTPIGGDATDTETKDAD